jgi:hypothetical protein
MSIDTLTADTSISRAFSQVANKNWETPIPNGIQENEMPDTGTVDMDFWDFVDIVNPLQHIPVVSSIYRELTGDTIKGVSRIVGDGLYGGVIGLVVGVGSAIIAETTGKDPGEHVLAMLTGSGDEAPAQAGNTAVADATPSTAAPSTNASANAAAPASPTSTPVQQTQASTRTAMAEPATAGDILMPAARAAAPTQRRLGEPEARSFAVPKRTPGLLPKQISMVPTGPAAKVDKTPVQRAAAQLAADRTSARPTASQAAQAQAEPQSETRLPGQAQNQAQSQIQGQAQNQTAAWPPGGSAKVPPELIADMMMNALDKYKQGARTGTAAMANGAGAARGAF